MGTPQHQHMKELVAADRLHDKVTALSFAASTSEQPKPEVFLASLDKAVRAASAKAPEKKKRYEALQQLLIHVGKPETQRKLRLVNILAQSPLSEKAHEELVAPFADQNDNDALLNDVLNAHPLAARLWGNRVAWLAAPNLNYTKHYEEFGSTGLFPDVSAHPAYKEAIDSPTADAPALGPYPFNSGLEEIQHLKMLQLAKLMGFDLQSDIGVASFDSFIHNYEVSPGELTLDRVWSYPPPLHTYDELPILKFYGWDEADVPEDYEDYLHEKGVAKPVPHAAH